jgi:hypothetical protein
MDGMVLSRRDLVAPSCIAPCDIREGAKLVNRLDRLNRRSLFRVAGWGAGGLMLSSRAMAAVPGFTPPSAVDTGHVEKGKVVFPVWRDPADTPSGPTPAPLPPEQRVGFTIVGLGRLALEEILPAFAQSMKARPVALVSGSPEKLRLVATQYGIKPVACYSYESFDSIRHNPEIKVVYIVLPNAMHRLLPSARQGPASMFSAKSRCRSVPSMLRRWSRPASRRVSS